VSLCGIGGLRVATISNVDVLPLKRKELPEYILVSLVSALWLFRSLTCILLVYLLACLSLVGNSSNCIFSEFTLCQDIIEKE
jgi:hypothetical protein